MPHVHIFKAGQRVIVRELRGCMEQDGIKVGDVGMTMRMVNGDLGVQFDHLGGVFVRYAPGLESLVVNCCDVVESAEKADSSASKVNPWDHFWTVTKARQKARRRVMDRKFMLTDQAAQLMAYFESKERIQ